MIIKWWVLSLICYTLLFLYNKNISLSYVFFSRINPWPLNESYFLEIDLCVYMNLDLWIDFTQFFIK